MVSQGERFVLALGVAGAENAGALSLVCAAAYCRELAPSLYGVGAEFLQTVGGGASAQDDAAMPVEFREFLRRAAVRRLDRDWLRPV